jgi:ECF transporter S component (folate family)
MSTNNRSRFTAKRLALNAAMVALYFALSMMAVPVGGFKLTFEHLPIILCAVLFGPVDALIVGALGEFINQMLTFGFTPTTILWMAPAMFRGLSMGLAAVLARKSLGLDAQLEKKVPVAFWITCITSGLICSLLNTFTLYVDSKMFGYYSYAMVFGVLWIRLAASAVSSVVMSLAVKPVAVALRKAKLI